MPDGAPVMRRSRGVLWLDGHDPDVSLFGEGEAGRKYSDDGEGAPEGADLAANCFGVAAKTPLPEGVADHRHVGGTEIVLLGSGQSSPRGVHAHDFEELLGDDSDAGELSGVSDHYRTAVATAHVGAERIEDGVLRVQVVEVRLRYLAQSQAVVVAPDVAHHHDAARFAKVEWTQQHGIDHAEDGGVGADAERQDRDGQDGESGAGAQRAERELQFHVAALGHARCHRQVVDL